MQTLSKRFTSSLTAVALLATALVGATAAADEPDERNFAENPVQYVDTIIGTGSGGSSVGEINNFPGATVPFGMVQYSPDTPGHYAGYNYANDRIRSFSMTHASVGCWAFGDVPMLPSTADLGTQPWNHTERYSHDREDGQAGYYTVDLLDSDITAELSATTYTGIGRFDYPDNGRTARFDIRPGDTLWDGKYAASMSIGEDGVVTGSATVGQFCGKPHQFTVYFAMEFDQPITGFGTWDQSSIFAGQRDINATRAGGWVEFDPGVTLNVRTALSYTSVEGARANLVAEGSPTLEQARAAASDEWNDLLGKVRVSGEHESEYSTFYTALYHSLLHPNTFNDADGKYIGFDGVIRQLPEGEKQYANFADWDTSRSLIQLQTMLVPDIASDLAQSMVRNAEQSGSLPRWAIANTATGQMTGDSIVPLIANIYAYGGRDFDTATALSYMKKSALEGGIGLNGYEQRPGASIVNELGYVPQLRETAHADHKLSGASMTLEYALADFSTSQFAAALGDTATSDEFQARSQRWQNLFNPTTRYISPRSVSGSFPDGPGFAIDNGFGQDGFDEGNAAQYAWLVPHNIAGLTHALGGRDVTAQRLTDFTSQTNVGPNQPYLWIGNEPNFSVPWLFNFLGQPWKTQQLVDRIRTSHFSPTPNGQPGNDDLGAQSSWFIWAALGMYPVTPSTTTLSVHTPMFNYSEIELGNGNIIRVDAPGTSGRPAVGYIESLTVDGQPHTSTALPLSLPLDGGHIEYTLADEPTTWGTGVDAAPPSYGAASSDITANSAPRVVKFERAGTATVDVDVQAMTDAATSFTVSATSTVPGVTIEGPASGSFDASGAGGATLTVSATDDVVPGYYTIPIVVTAGDTERKLSVLVHFAPANTLVAAYNLVATAPENQANVAKFDDGITSYSQEQLALNGLTPGARVELSDSHFMWPDSPVGLPDALEPDSQFITVPGEPSLLRFIGASRNGNAQGTVTVHLNDGTTAEVNVGLGDWVLPTPNGDPVYGNEIVATMTKRNNDSGGAFVFATEPYTAPAGKTITAVTFPKQPQQRIFAFATNAIEVPDTDTLESLGVARSVVAGAQVSGYGVRVVNGDGAAVRDVPVTFTITGPATFAGGNSVAVTSNAAGIAIAPRIATTGPGVVTVTAERGDVSLALPTLTVTEPEVAEAAFTVTPQLVAGRWSLVVSGTGPWADGATVRLNTRYGTKTFTGVAAGATIEHTFKTFVSKLPAGAATIRITDGSESTELEVLYDAQG